MQAETGQRRITRGMLPCRTRASCTDSTGNGTDCTLGAEIIRPPGPRTGPRLTARPALGHACHMVNRQPRTRRAKDEGRWRSPSRTVTAVIARPRKEPPFGIGMVPSVRHAGAAQIGFDLCEAGPIADTAVSHAGSALCGVSSVVSSVLVPAGPGRGAARKAVLRFLALTVGPRGWGPARWSRRDAADFVQWRQARGQRRPRPHPPAVRGLPGQPE